MRTWWRGVLCVPLLGAAFGPAVAQQAGIMAGGGVTFSGPDISAKDVHGLAGVTYRFRGLAGVRVDGMATAVPQSRLAAVSGDVVLHFRRDAEAGVQPYLLAGGTVFFPEGSTEGGLNGGLGAAVRMDSRLGLFVEGRYFRILNYLPLRDDLLLASAGIRVRL